MPIEEMNTENQKQLCLMRSYKISFCDVLKMMNSFCYIHRIKCSYETRYQDMHIIVDIWDITARTHIVTVNNNNNKICKHNKDYRRIIGGLGMCIFFSNVSDSF